MVKRKGVVRHSDDVIYDYYEHYYTTCFGFGLYTIIYKNGLC